ncbi:MAG TPA: ABC transporter substrate-binding protein [Acetobacteraceae bacterium]|jgi:branched-chain amino acid transport system substrate-binding protein|nr:ABC transporter substrate-binding protein [Acetobacteraceae bacterium]
MPRITRRAALAGLAAVPLAKPGIIRAQSTSKSVKIGLLSDMSGPYRDVGGPGNKVAVALAVEDIGGSVLGRPVEILQGDDQNKPDVAAALAREWIDSQGVDALTDGAASSSGLAVQQIAFEKKRPYLITGPATSDMTGPKCTPYGIHFSYDTYALANGTGTALTKAGGDSWFFVTADYAFGYALERDTINAVKKNGGKVLGVTRAPLATPDFSSFLVQAQSSGAKVLGLANAGTDLQNCIKQAAEFGISGKGMKVATLLMQISDVNSLGQKTCEGLIYTDSFYWDMTDKTRAWSKRWGAKMGGMVPGLLHAGQYCAAYHWLKAVQAAGTTDADAVVAKMKATKVNDFYNTEVTIRQDGRVMHQMYLWQVKPAAESKYKYDFCKNLAVIKPEDAWRPMSEGGCPYVKAT